MRMRTRVWRRWAGLAATLAATTLVFALLRRSLPDPGTLSQVLAAARCWWLGPAVLLQVGSLLMYAVQQRWLLAALGGNMSLRRAVAVSLARAALSTAMPAGGPVSTAFAVRQFRAHRLTGAAALAATLLVSVQASAATLLVYLGWCIVTALEVAVLPSAVAALAVLGVAAVLVHRAASHVARRRAAAPPRRADHRRPGTAPNAITRWGRVLVRFGADAMNACASLSRQDWLRTGAAAVARRLFDLACLVAVTNAFGLDIGTASIVGAYLAGLLVRQIPLAAGGAGLVEASLLAFLVDAGAGAATAAAVVLAYRLLSCWLVALAGLPALISLGTAPSRADVGVARPAAPEFAKAHTAGRIEC